MNESGEGKTSSRCVFLSSFSILFPVELGSITDSTCLSSANEGMALWVQVIDIWRVGERIKWTGKTSVHAGLVN